METATEIRGLYRCVSGTLAWHLIKFLGRRSHDDNSDNSDNDILQAAATDARPSLATRFVTCDEEEGSLSIRKQRTVAATQRCVCYLLQSMTIERAKRTTMRRCFVSTLVEMMSDNIFPKLFFAERGLSRLCLCAESKRGEVSLDSRCSFIFTRRRCVVAEPSNYRFAIARVDSSNRFYTFLFSTKLRARRMMTNASS